MENRLFAFAFVGRLGSQKECQMWVREKVTNGPFLVGRCEGLRGKKGLLKNKPVFIIKKKQKNKQTWAS